MNNSQPSSPMNIFKLTEQAVSAAAMLQQADSFEATLPIKSLEEMNAACLAQIRGDCETCSSSAATEVAKNSDANRPTKRRKSSEVVSSADSSASSCAKGYDEGINVQTSPSSSSSLPALLYNLGLYNLKQGQDASAVKLFTLARDVCKRDEKMGHPDVNVDQISISHNIGCIYYRQQEYKKALDAFTGVEVLSLVKYGPHHLSVASALNCIGVVLFHTMEEGDNSSKDAIDALFEALSIRTSILGTEHKDVATTINNIGRVYFDIGDYPKALQYYDEALRLRRQVLGPHHADVAATSFNAGQSCHKLGQLDESLALYQEYHTITSHNDLDEQNQGTVTALKYIGQVYHEKSQMKEAYATYQEALKSSRQVLGAMHRETASILNLLGNLLYENGDFDEAIEVYEEGLKVERAVLHRHCNNITVTLSNIGQALMQKGKYQAALGKYNEVHSIHCLSSDRVDKKIFETLSIIGQICTLLGRFSQAERAFLKVIAMTKDAEGYNQLDVALALNYLGLVYFKQGALNSAMEKFQESLRVRSGASKTSIDVAVLLYNIASIYLHKGDNDSALAHYRRALDVERTALGEVHPDVAMTLKLIGKVYDRCGQFEEAIKHYTEALDIYVKCYGSDSPYDEREHKKNAARMLALIASVELRHGAAERMTSALAQAYRLFDEIGAPVQELELEMGFDLYEISILHPECAAAA